MIRVVAFAVLLVLLWVGVTGLLRFLSNHEIDWRGVAFGIAFVMLAFWLQHVTGTGQLFG